MKISEAAVPGFLYADCAAGGANTTDSVAGIQGTILNANAYAGAGTGILGGDYRCEENKTAHNIKIATSAANAAGFSADTTSVATFSGWFRQIGGLSGNNTDYPQISWSKWGNCGVLWNTKNGQNNNTTAGIEAGVESAQKENGPYDQVRRFVLRDQKTGDSDAKHDCDSSTIQSFFDAQWHHVAISYDGTRATVYVDGVAQSAFNAERKFSNPGSGNVIRFGNRADSAPDCVWTGDLDEFRFRSAASSADWVAAEYASVATDGFLAFGAPGASSTILFY